MTRTNGKLTSWVIAPETEQMLGEICRTMGWTRKHALTVGIATIHQQMRARAEQEPQSDLLREVVAKLGLTDRPHAPR